MLFIDRASVSIGADPEFFVKRNDDFISGHAFPCGTKLKPRATPHGKVQNDGLALELNVSPAFTKGAFVLNFRGVVNDLVDIVTKWDRECYIVADSVGEFTEAYLDSLPRTATELGCNPDYNAYEQQENPMPDAKVNFRTGAGHLHIGWTENQEGFEHFVKCCDLVKQLDYTVGLRTLIFDTEPRRRMLYGKAGAFRPKPYGAEYRTPSNAWCQSETRAEEMYDSVMQGIDLLNNGVILEEKYPNMARDLINANQTDWWKTETALAKELGL